MIWENFYVIVGAAFQSRIRLGFCPVDRGWKAAPTKQLNQIYFEKIPIMIQS